MSEEFEIADFGAVFSAVHEDELPIVVGGQAANIWALIYSERPGNRLASYRPFTSKDLDLAGDRQLLAEIHRTVGGELCYAPPRSPVIGYVEAVMGEGVRKIEVLRDVRGLTRDEMADALVVTVGSLRLRVLAPIKVLKAKLCNSVTLDQDSRNDVNHIRIMIECSREFITDILGEAEQGHITQRGAVNFLEELLETVTSRHATMAEQRWKLGLGSIWPRDELEASGLQKILRFAQHRLPTED
jgi:hypothetical protein